MSIPINIFKEIIPLFFFIVQDITDEQKQIIKLFRGFKLNKLED